MKTLFKLALLAAVTFLGYGAPKALEVYCNLTWLQVNLKALTFGDWYVLSDEVFLGHGCPVSTVFQDMYVFWYPTSDCGIQSQVFKRKVVFKTSLTFISRTSSMRGFTPISCTVDQDKSLPQPPGTVFIDPRQAQWLASPTYQEYYEENMKCLNVRPSYSNV